MKNKLKICVIASHKNFYVPQRLMAAGKKRGHDMHMTTWEDLSVCLDSGKLFIGERAKDLKLFDAIIPRSDRYTIKIGGKRISRNFDTLFRLTSQYAKLHDIFFLNNEYFTKYQSIDKLAQQFFFSENHLPGIPTFYASSVKKIMRGLKKFPLVAKVSQGSLGKSVFLLKTTAELENFIKARNCQEEFFLFQKYYKINHDYRVLVVGKKVLGAMKRTPRDKDEWRTNFSLGGNVARCEIDKQMAKLALNIAKKMKLDYAGIDLLESEGKFKIIETNSLPQFKGFEKVFPDVDVAEEIIGLIENKARKS